MLLKEVVLKPRVRNDAEDRWEYDVDWNKSAIQPIGVQTVRVRPHYEEIEMFKRYGFNQSNLPSFPVIYAYTYTKNAPTENQEIDDSDDNNMIRGSMHALKSRHPNHHMKPETLKDIYVKGFEKIKKSKPPGKRYSMVECSKIKSGRIQKTYSVNGCREGAVSASGRVQ